MGTPLNELATRLDKFCRDYSIPKKHHGTIRLLSDMCWTLGVEPRDVDAMPVEQAKVQETTL